MVHRTVFFPQVRMFLFALAFFALAILVTGCCGPREIEPETSLYVKNGCQIPLYVQFTQTWNSSGNKWKEATDLVRIAPRSEQNLHVSLENADSNDLSASDSEGNRISHTAVPSSVAARAKGQAVHVLLGETSSQFRVGPDTDRDLAMEIDSQEQKLVVGLVAIGINVCFWTTFWRRRQTAR